MSVRIACLSLGVLFATALWGLALYADDAVAGNAPYEGYGITADFIAANS